MLAPIYIVLFICYEVEQYIHVLFTVHFCPLAPTATYWKGAAASLVMITSAYLLHMFCACVVCIHVCCLLYVACSCVACRLCCVTRNTFSVCEVDMALLSVNQLTCGVYMVSRVECCVDIVLADSAHCVLVVMVGCSVFLTRSACSCRMEWEKKICWIDWNRLCLGWLVWRSWCWECIVM